MASINLIEAFQEFKDAENIDRPTLMRVVEDVFKTLLRKKYGSDENFDVIVNAEKGDLEIFRRRTIVEDGDIYNTLEEIEYKDAVKIEPDYSGSEELYEEVNLYDFGSPGYTLPPKQTLGQPVFSEFEEKMYWAKKNNHGTGIVPKILQWPKSITQGYGKKKKIFCFSWN